MGVVRLDDISFGDEDVDEALQLWRKAIEAAMNWKITGHCSFTATPDGSALHVKGASTPISGVVATGGITAAPNANTLGQGNVTLRYRTGAALVDGPVVLTYSNFSTAITAGTRVEVVPDGEAYKLVASNCP